MGVRPKKLNLMIPNKSKIQSQLQSLFPRHPSFTPNEICNILSKQYQHLWGFYLQEQLNKLLQGRQFQVVACFDVTIDYQHYTIIFRTDFLRQSMNCSAHELSTIIHNLLTHKQAAERNLHIKTDNEIENLSTSDKSLAKL